MLFCSIILKFGKKRDLVSAVKTFELSKQYMSSPNMHAYRTIIDVCGLCGDYWKSRTIYEVCVLVLSEPLVVYQSVIVILGSFAIDVKLNCLIILSK